MFGKLNEILNLAVETAATQTKPVYTGLKNNTFKVSFKKLWLYSQIIPGKQNTIPTL